MILIFNKDYSKVEYTSLSNINLNEINWINISNPTLKEEEELEKLLKIDIPTKWDRKNKLLKNKLYEDNNIIYMKTVLNLKENSLDKHLKPHKIILIIVNNILVTISDKKIDFIHNLKYFDYYKYASIENSFLKTLLVLVENLVNNSASYLENMGYLLDEENAKISKNKENNNLTYKEIVNKITHIEDSISRTRESFISFSRMLDFLGHVEKFSNDARFSHHIKIFFKEIALLIEHTNFLSNKANFLLSIVLGLVNIEQNDIMKIFSVVSVVFTPPTLIASIYGMNFDFMPELKWPFGYPLALIIMLLSSWLPYKFFKYKKWL